MYHMPAEHSLLLPTTFVSLLHLKAGGEKNCIKSQLALLDFYCFHKLISSNWIVLQLPK